MSDEQNQENQRSVWPPRRARWRAITAPAVSTHTSPRPTLEQVVSAASPAIGTAVAVIRCAADGIAAGADIEPVLVKMAEALEVACGQQLPDVRAMARSFERLAKLDGSRGLVCELLLVAAQRLETGALHLIAAVGDVRAVARNN